MPNSHIKLLIVFILTWNTAKATLFDTLFVIPKEERYDHSIQLLNDHFSESDSLQFFRYIADLNQRAGDDKYMHIVLGATEGLFRGKVLKKRTEGVDLMKMAAEQAEKQGEEVLQAKILHEMSFLLSGEEGLFALLNANRMMQEVGYENIYNITKYLSDIGSLYYHFGNYKRAVFYLEEVLKYVQKSNNEMMAYLRMGLSFQKMEMYDMALKQFHQAREIALTVGDSVFAGMVSGNIGAILFLQGELQKAKELLYIDYKTSVENNEKISVIRSLISLADVYLQEGNIEKARECIEEARQNVFEHDFADRLDIITDLYRILAEVYAHFGHYKEAYINLDSARVKMEYLQKVRDRNMLANVEMQLTTQSHLAELALLEKEKFAQRVIRNAAIGVTILVLLLFSSILVNLRNKQKRRQRIYELEKQKSEEKLSDFKARIQDKNRLIESFEAKFSEYQSALEKSDNEQSGLNQLYEQIILTEDDWIQFKSDFENVYPGFIAYLGLKFPELSPAEMRLLMLIKLNLSLKEIAKILGISPESVRKTRHRLMRKLNIANYKELPGFVASIVVPASHRKSRYKK